MARTLKTTISGSIASSNVQMLLAVDDDNTTLKDFSANAVAITNTGVTVTTANTWKGTTVPMFVFGDSTDKLVLGSSTPNVLSPCTIFVIVKNDTSPTSSNTIAYGSATAAGSADVDADPYIDYGTNPSPRIKSAIGGTIVSQPSVTIATGDDYSVFWTSNTSGSNQTWFALEANTLNTTGTTAPNYQHDPSGVTLNGYLKQFGTNGSPFWNASVVMIGVLNLVISGTDAASIHADPFGTLFDAGGASAPLAQAQYFARLRSG